MGLTGVQVNRMSKRFKGASSALLGFGNTVRNVGNQVLILGFQLSFLASGAFVAVVNQAVKFEESMTKIITLVGVGEKQVAAFADRILDMAPDLGKSPNELAEALFVITSAGILEPAAALDVLEFSAKAASIGLGKTEDVARVLTGVMQAYGEEVISVEEATDVLVATVRKGNLEVDSLAPTLGRVIGLASEMGISFAEVGAFIATFTRVNVPAEVAVTSLRSAINAVIRPTAQSSAKLAEYGITISDIQAAIADPEVGLHSVLLGLVSVFGDDNTAIAEVIGSVRGLAGVMVVTGGLAEEYPEIFAEIDKSLGITEEGFNTFSKTTSFLAASTKASLESLAITIGAALLPGINKLLEGLSPLVASFRQFAELHPRLILLIGAFAGVVTIIGPLLIVTGLLISSIGTLLIAFGSLAAFIGIFLTPLGLLAAAFITLFGAIAVAVGISLGDAQKKLDERGKSLSRSAFNWGKNLILSFARGMGQATAAVVRVIIIIGEFIRDQLRALSPPKLLPDIELWGLRTMEAWIEGWLLADFSIFNKVADLVESAIDSLTFESDFGDLFTEQEALSAIANFRVGLADLLTQLKETGQVAKEAVDNLFTDDVLGASTKALKDYVFGLIDLEKANQARHC
jgi:TP901 family phage tail tape measure protein